MSTYRQSREQIYLAAQGGRPHWSSENCRIAELLRSYNFKVFLPEDVRLSDRPNPAELEAPLDESKMMIAVFHTETPCPRVAYELKEACRRALPVFALSAVDPATLPSELTKGLIKVLPLYDNDDALLHPLMSTINRWYPV